MVQRLPTGYVFDPEDPRAPAAQQWAQMPPDERARVVAMLDEVIPGQGKAERVAVELSGKLAEDPWLREEAQRLREEEKRLREEEQRLREEAQRKVAEARAEIERIKKGSG
jgi:hypothetical protein